nr:ankyrin repeat and socs box protein 3 [Quercus suber]
MSQDGLWNTRGRRRGQHRVCTTEKGREVDSYLGNPIRHPGGSAAKNHVPFKPGGLTPAFKESKGCVIASSVDDRTSARLRTVEAALRNVTRAWCPCGRKRDKGSSRATSTIIDRLSGHTLCTWLGINEALSNTEPPVLRYVIRTGVNAILTKNSIALHDISLVHWLLLKGADPNATCDIDFTPLSIAVNRYSFSVTQLLLQHAQHSHNGHLVYYAMQRADMNESVRMIRLLHQHSKPIDEILYQDAKSSRLRAQFLRGTPLYYACNDGKLEVALTLLELGADPDKACMRYDQTVRRSPRKVAIDHGWTLLQPPAYTVGVAL